jgi:hypothetical protein
LYSARFDSVCFSLFHLCGEWQQLGFVVWFGFWRALFSLICENLGSHCRVSKLRCFGMTPCSIIVARSAVTMVQSINRQTSLSSQSFPLLPVHSRCRGCLFSLDHTQTHITVGRTSLNEGSARRRDLYLTTQTLYKRQKSMPPVGFEPAIPTSALPQTYALVRAAAGIGDFTNNNRKTSHTSFSVLILSVLSQFRVT